MEKKEGENKKGERVIISSDRRALGLM